ncbi:helix-turn-helix transcriptional regulator [Lewinella sp. 4G2]|uniref:helix-turn-helix transcriptional regulator n=1 Tax=Lewinella sp. 4G2 TaxID=1803372 RepID=UPI0007B47DDF|nr:helix-turn-helix transcriptional regulator [Lewinella sp. 4G2]OAV44062.1 hypothetical protein A3850_005925 [Lewinella sp. 4G2]
MDQGLADTIRLQAADRLVNKSCRHTQPDSATFYAEAQLALAREIGHGYWVARALQNIGNLQLRSGDYPSAVLNFKQSLRFYEEDKAWHRAGQTSLGLGNALRKQGHIPEALEALLASLDYAAKSGSKSRSGRAATLNSLGSLYLNQQDYETAVKYYEESLDLHNLLGSQRGIAANLNNLSKVYTEWGKFAVAIDYLDRSLALKRKANDLEGITNSLKNYGDVYFKSNQLDSATAYYTQARVLQDSLGLRGDEASSYGDLGLVALARKDWATARDYCATGWQQSERLGDLKVQVKNGDCLYQAQLQLGEHEVALATLERTYSLRDSFLSAENTRELAEIQSRYAEDRAKLTSAVGGGSWWRFIIGALACIVLLGMAWRRFGRTAGLDSTLPNVPSVQTSKPGVEEPSNSEDERIGDPSAQPVAPPAGAPAAMDPWVAKATSLVLTALRERREVTTSSLAREMTSSERQLLRRCKEVTGKTTNQFLLEVRLDHARQLLEEEKVKSVAELAEAVGFKSPTYFSQRFTDRFGFRPKEKLVEA